MASQKLYFSLPLQTYERPRSNQIHTNLTALSVRWAALHSCRIIHRVALPLSHCHSDDRIFYFRMIFVAFIIINKHLNHVMKNIKFSLPGLLFILCIHSITAQERKLPELTKARLELYMSSFESINNGYKNLQEKYEGKLTDSDNNDERIVTQLNSDRERMFTSNGWKSSKDYEDVSASIALAKQVVDAEKASEEVKSQLGDVPETMRPQMLQATKTVIEESKAQMKSFGMTEKELGLVRANYERIEAL